ncbi:MAG: hypothetical protein II972_05915 [Elusimicrobiaceae bacterium]|nr:hypothetical protein [Elusimicrobiaceae bacterium]
MKKFLCVFSFFIFAFTALFAADNMRIAIKEQGEVISGFKVVNSSNEAKINILYPANYNTIERAPLVLILDTKEYNIEQLRQMFYGKVKTNPQTLIASVKFKNNILSQEQFDAFIEDIFAFLALNYKSISEPSKRIILARNNFALLALNSIQKEANYFFNLGLILDNTTSLPAFNNSFKNGLRFFAFSQRENIVNLQNLFMAKGLKPLQNFFLKISGENSFEKFDLRYFLNSLPEIKQIKPVLPKEILQQTPFYLQVKTSYGFLDFMPTTLKFAPPVLIYEAETGYLKTLLQEPLKIKISGVFVGKKWSKKVKIAK